MKVVVGRDTQVQGHNTEITSNYSDSGRTQKKCSSLKNLSRKRQLLRVLPNHLSAASSTCQIIGNPVQGNQGGKRGGFLHNFSAGLHQTSRHENRGPGSWMTRAHTGTVAIGDGTKQQMFLPLVIPPHCCALAQWAEKLFSGHTFPFPL